MRKRFFKGFIKFYRKWILGECRHVCKKCRFNDNCYYEEWWLNLDTLDLKRGV